MNNKSKCKRSFCPITNSLDLLGDKWTILIVRNLVLCKERYQEFLSSPEKIPTNIQADRLKHLCNTVIVVKQAYQHNPVRYEYSLTSRGKRLREVLKALASWGLKSFPGTKVFSSVRSKEQTFT